MMKIDYARVSSNNQDLELQKQELQKAGCTQIFSEPVSRQSLEIYSCLSIQDSQQEYNDNIGKFPI